VEAALSHESRTHAGDVQTLDAEEGYVAQRGNTYKEVGENSIMGSLIICTPHQILFGCSA